MVFDAIWKYGIFNLCYYYSIIEERATSSHQQWGSNYFITNTFGTLALRQQPLSIIKVN